MIATKPQSEIKRVILLMRVSTYRAQPFYQAAEHLSIEIVPGLEMHPDLADYWQAPLPLQFDKPDEAVQTIVRYAADNPVQAILSVDDSASEIAAKASATLGLTHNSAKSALAARNKYHMRRLFAESGVPSPNFRLYDMADDAARAAAAVDYPCVLKPLLLSGSRGVVRVDNVVEFEEAFRWLGRFLAAMARTPGSTQILVEDYIPGCEVALEGIIDRGRVRVLALFDKPDPLEGPFFEETIYVTPSRLPAAIQADIAICAEQAASALGLNFGPVHAELRLNEAGPWLVEMAGRSIGGLCSQTLSFGLEGISLETLILRQAVGLEIDSLAREDKASGVMMIPIPATGILTGITGVEAAAATAGVDKVEITAKINYPVTRLPEGDSYLGFIFAQGDDPAWVEQALREAHTKLRFEIMETLTIV
jgi:biotin carboxylase